MRTRNLLGFTLVELLVVIAIIVILLAIMIPSLKSALRKADTTKCAANQRNIAQVLVGYALNGKKNFPPSVASRTFFQNKNDQGANVATADSMTFAYAMDYRALDQTTFDVVMKDHNTTLAVSRTPGGVSALSDSRARGFVSASLPRVPDVIQGATASPTGTATTNNGLGLGHLVTLGLLPATKLGEIAHCPSLNTASSSPSPNFGTDNVYTVSTTTATTNDDNDAGNDPNNTTNQSGNAAGGSFWVDAAQVNNRIIGSYNYRGLSYALTHGGTATIQYYQVNADFVLLSDLISVQYGRRFHHLNGYNVAYGDGSARFFKDEPDANDFGRVEKAITQIGAFTQYNEGNPTPIDGRSGYDATTNVSVDERIFTSQNLPAGSVGLGK